MKSVLVNGFCKDPNILDYWIHCTINDSNQSIKKTKKTHTNKKKLNNILFHL
jgi:hypothetical protein